MSADYAPKPRPYWQVDAKWITGLLLVFVFSVTLLLYNLVQITAEKPAVDTLSMAMALALSSKGLDDETEITGMLQRLQVSPDESIQLIPGLRIIIRKQDLAGLSPRQTRLYFFRQWAEPIYKAGSEGLAALADDPEMKSRILQGGGFLNALTLKTHRTLRRALAISAMVSLMLFIPLVFFSSRFGRIGSPGCVLFAASLPGAILFGFVSTVSQRAQATPPPREAGMTALGGYVASHILPPLAQLIARTYLIFLALGLGLMLLAVLSNLVWWLITKVRQTRLARETAS